MDKLFNDILDIQSVTSKEFAQQQFILDYVRKDLNLCYEYDEHGNIYIFPTGKKDIPMPCMVAHMDTVHDIVPGAKVITEVEVARPYTKTTEIEYDDRTEFIKTVFKGEKETRISSPTGIGGDDKCGIYAALMVAKEMEIKILFTVEEEAGGLGAEEVDFDIHPLYFLEVDRKGSDDIVVESRTTLADGDFRKKLEEIGIEFGFELSETGSFTDVDALHVYDVQACNISAGYYNAHQKTEYIVFEELQNTIAFCKSFISRVDTLQPGPVEKKKIYGHLTTTEDDEEFSWDKYFNNQSYKPCTCGNETFTEEEIMSQTCYECLRGLELATHSSPQEEGVEVIYCSNCASVLDPSNRINKDSNEIYCSDCFRLIPEDDALSEGEAIELLTEREIAEMDKKDKSKDINFDHYMFIREESGKLRLPLIAYAVVKQTQAIAAMEKGQTLVRFQSLKKKQRKYILNNKVDLIK